MKRKKSTIIVHSGDFDKLMSAFILGNGFLAMGFEVTLFFTFWGLQALTKKGLTKARLSRLNMFGLGKMMIKKRLKKYNVASLEELAQSFKELGGKIIACTMTMELMHVKKDELQHDLIDEFGTVGKYCYETKDADVTLFI